MMNVAIDATPLAGPRGGVARYVAELSRALALSFPRDDFWLLSDQDFANPAPGLPNLKTGRGPRSVLERRWWLWGLQGELTRLDASVFHGTDFSVPYLPVRPSVMTVHDLSPWKEPRWHEDSDRVRRRTPILLRMGLATMIITPTEAIRREAIERFRLPPARVIAVPHAAPANFRPTEIADSNGAYFLCVGTLEPRKNIETLIDAWRQVHATHPLVELVLAGRRRADFGELPSEPGLRVLGEVTEEELPSLYSGARACIYPSWYEGFGLPVLEAMQCGTPVIASNGAAIAEVAGDAAWLIDPRDPKAWAEALEIAIDQPGWRQEWQARCLLRAAEFSWERTASETHKVYDEAIRRFRRKR